MKFVGHILKDLYYQYIKYVCIKIKLIIEPLIYLQFVWHSLSADYIVNNSS